MKVYVIWADTHEGGYGCEVELFAVCDSEEKVNDVVSKIDKGVFYVIEEMELNKVCRTYLAGYFE